MFKKKENFFFFSSNGFLFLSIYLSKSLISFAQKLHLDLAILV